MKRRTQIESILNFSLLALTLVTAISTNSFGDAAQSEEDKPVPFSHAEEKCLASIKSKLMKSQFRFLPVQDQQVNLLITKINADNVVFSGNMTYIVVHSDSSTSVNSLDVLSQTKNSEATPSSFESFRASVTASDEKTAVFEILLKANFIEVIGLAQSEKSLKQLLSVDENCRLSPLKTIKLTHDFDGKLIETNSREVDTGHAAEFVQSQPGQFLPPNGAFDYGPQSDEISIGTSVSDGATWEKTRLSPNVKQDDLSITLSHGTVLSASPLTIAFESKEPLGFRNFSAYWVIQKSSVLKKRDAFKQKLIMQSAPSIDYGTSDQPVGPDQAGGNRYLSESQFLNISNPVVQEQLNQLKKNIKPGMTRADIVREIVKFIPSVLRFDRRMIADGLYAEKMKTSDVLLLGQAMCQHFANLFAALARGLGVPARIIGGLDLSGRSGVGFHAWNEFEIRTGVWVPVEPQRTELRFDPAHYIPLFIQHFEARPFRGPIPSRLLDSENYKLILLKSGPESR